MRLASWTAILLTGSLAACGSEPAPDQPTPDAGPVTDSGTDGSDTSPLPPLAPGEARIVFPPGPSTATQAATLHVRGVANSASVTVNGQPATSDDGFATWSIDLPLAAGVNPITVATDLETSAASTVVVQRPLEHQLTPSQIRILPDGDALVGDYNLYRMNVQTGVLTRFETDVLSEGGAFFSADFRAGAFVVDSDRVLTVSSVGNLNAFDLATGALTMLAAVTIPADSESVGIRDLAVDDARGQVVLATATGVATVDLATAETSPLVDGVSACALAVDSDTLYALVNAPALTLVTANLATRTSTRLAVGTSSCAAISSALAVRPTDHALFASTGSAVGRIDVATGHFTRTNTAEVFGLAFDPATGDLLGTTRGGNDIGLVADLTLSPTAAEHLVADRAFGDAVSGDRTYSYVLGDVQGQPGALLTYQQFGPLEALDVATMTHSAIGTAPEGTVAGLVGNRVAVGGEGCETCGLEIHDAATGALLLTSTASSPGDAFDTYFSYVFPGVLPGGKAAAFDKSALMSVDLATGARQLISGRGRGTGLDLPLDFGFVNGGVIDAANNRVLALRNTTGGDCHIVAADLTTGDRTCAYAPGVEEYDVQLVSRGGDLYVASAHTEGSPQARVVIRKLDLASASSTIVSDVDAGVALDFIDNFVRMTYDPARDVFVVTEAGGTTLVFVDPITGQRVSPVAL